MKNTFLILIGLVFVLTACHEEPDWLGDNTTTEGRHFPVISTFTTNGFVSNSSESEYFIGSSIPLDLRYWSFDPIESVTLRKIETGVEETIYTEPYTSRVSEGSGTDSLYYEYLLPSSIVDNITIEAQVLNTNGLDRTRSIDFCICHEGPYTPTSVTVSIDTVDVDGNYQSAFTGTSAASVSYAGDTYQFDDLSGGLYETWYGSGAALADDLPDADICKRNDDPGIDFYHNNDTTSMTLSLTKLANQQLIVNWENSEAGIRGTSTYE